MKVAPVGIARTVRRHLIVAVHRERWAEPGAHRVAASLDVHPEPQLAWLLAGAVLQELTYGPQRAAERKQVGNLERRKLHRQVEQRVIGDDGPPAMGDDRHTVVT